MAQEGTYEDDFTMLNGTLMSVDGSEVHLRDGASGYVLNLQVKLM